MRFPQNSSTDKAKISHVMKDMISLNAIDHLELTNKRGGSVQINKPILGLEVDKLRKLNPATLKI